MVRAIQISTKELIGKPVKFEGMDVGHIIDVLGIKADSVIMCAIDDDTVLRAIRDNDRQISIEVIK